MNLVDAKEIEVMAGAIRDCMSAINKINSSFVPSIQPNAGPFTIMINVFEMNIPVLLDREGLFIIQPAIIEALGKRSARLEKELRDKITKHSSSTLA